MPEPSISISRAGVLARVIELTTAQAQFEAGKKPLPDLVIKEKTTFFQLGITKEIAWTDLSFDFEQEWNITFPKDIWSDQLTIGQVVDSILLSIRPK